MAVKKRRQVLEARGSTGLHVNKHSRRHRSVARDWRYRTGFAFRAAEGGDKVSEIITVHNKHVSCSLQFTVRSLRGEKQAATLSWML